MEEVTSNPILKGQQRRNGQLPSHRVGHRAAMEPLVWVRESAPSMVCTSQTPLCNQNSPKCPGRTQASETEENSALMWMGRNIE